MGCPCCIFFSLLFHDSRLDILVDHHVPEVLFTEELPLAVGVETGRVAALVRLQLQVQLQQKQKKNGKKR